MKIAIILGSAGSFFYGFFIGIPGKSVEFLGD
jgi:hypothetical protein